MMRKSKFLAGAAMTLALTASALAADKTPTNVGITVGTLGNPFSVPLVNGAKAAVSNANPKANVTDVGADYDLGKQSNLLDTQLVTKENAATFKGWDAAR